MKHLKGFYKRILICLAFIVFISAALIGCIDSSGPDAISSRGDAAPTDVSGYACIDCHLTVDTPAINPLTSNGSGLEGKHVAHYSSSAIACEVCHQAYNLSATHLDLIIDTDDPLINIVSFDSSNPSGTWINDSGAQTGQCSNTFCHGIDVPDWYGTAPLAIPLPCETCHDNPGRPGINPMLTNGSGTAGMHVKHYTTRALGCLKCHDGYYSTPTHNNGTMDTPDMAVTLVSFDLTNPSGTWTNDSGAGTGQCASTDCHSPSDMNWYDMSLWTTPTCPSCHDTAMGVRKPVMGAIGNFAGNAGMVSFHVADAVDPTDAKCIICHDQSYHMAGTIRLLDADTAAIVTLDESDLSTAEPFCLSCHDGDGANGDNSPFSDGITLGAARHKMSAEIESRWNRTYGHRQEGLTCIGTGEPNTGCHTGGHGSKYVGLMSKQLLMPNSNGPYTAAKEPNYALCFECHASYPAVTKEVVLGVKTGSIYDNNWWWWEYPPYKLASTQTKFLDMNGQGSGEPYDDAVSWIQYDNLHFFHLEDYYDSWFYRGVGSGFLPPSCITCHDVHGTDTQWGFLYDEFQYEHYLGTGSDEYAQMGILGADLPNHPINCSSAFNCHKVFDESDGGTSAWFAPAN